MVKRLTLLLGGKVKWSLQLRSLLFGLILLLLFLKWRPDGQFSYVGGILLALFLLYSLGVYIFEENDRQLFKTSFWITVISSVIGVGLISASSFIVISEMLGGIIFITAVSAIFSLILALMEFKITSRSFYFEILNIILLFVLLGVMFALSSPYYAGFWFLLLFLALYFMFKEVFAFEGVKGRKIKVSALILALLGGEIAWFLSILPLGVINSAIFLSLVLVIIKDAIITHFKGNFNVSYTLKQLTLFVILSLLIFAFSL